MKNIIREEINRTRELMGVINESNVVLEADLNTKQKDKNVPTHYKNRQYE